LAGLSSELRVPSELRATAKSPVTSASIGVESAPRHTTCTVI
jgi:hypothetical protein